MNKSRGRKKGNPRSQPDSSGRTGVALPASGSSTRAEAEITVFLSYARADDAVYKMVRPFKELLAHFVHAKSGRRIRTFLDQENINWGEIWRDRLESEILGASVFIPLLSANYLESEMCRLEFNRFQASATALGVSDLLLPVLVIDAPAIFNDSSPDDVVREAAIRNWEIIEDAVLADAGSSQWKRTMARLADRFVSAYDSAEATLADAEFPLSESVLADGSRSDLDDDDEDPGLAELMGSIQSEIADLTSVAQELGPTIADLGSAAESAGSPGPSATTQQIQAWSLRAAREFHEPAERISALGERMLNVTKALDVDMQRLRRIVIAFAPLAEGYNAMVGQLGDLDGVASQLEHLLTQFKGAELMSVPLRKSLRPARQGLTRVTDSLRLIQTWEPVVIEEVA